MSETTARRAVGYIRVSTGAQVREGESLGDQRAAIERYCEANEIELVDVIEDAGESGRDFRTRPGIEKVRRLAGRKAVNLLVARDMTRLGRSARELLNCLEYLETESRVAVVFLKERIDTSTPAGRLMRTVLAAVAEFEADMIRERTIGGRAARRARGIQVNGCGPVYGYTYISGDAQGNGRGYELNTDEAAVLRRVVGWVMNDGLPLRQCIKRLAAEGVATRTAGSQWRVRTVQRILSHPLMFGLVSDGRFEYEAVKSKTSGRTYKKAVGKPTAEWKELGRVQGATVMDRATFDQLQPLLSDLHKPRNVGPNDPFLLRGLLHCGCCSKETADGGRNFSHMTTAHGAPHRDGGRYPDAYACYWSLRPEEAKAAGRHECNGPRIPATEVDDIVWRFAKQCFLSPEILVSKLLRQENIADELREAERRGQNIDRQLAAIDRKQLDQATRLADAKVPARLAEQVIQKLEQQRTALTADRAALGSRLTELRTAVENRRVAQDAAKQLKQLGKAAEKMVDSLTTEERRAVIRAVTGGARLVVNTVHGRLMGWIPSEPDAFRVGEVTGDGPLAAQLATLGDTVRPLVDHRSKCVSGRVVKKLLAEGKSYRAIARELGVSPKTVHAAERAKRSPVPQGWRINLLGTIDAAAVINRLAEIAEKHGGSFLSDLDTAHRCSTRTGRDSSPRPA